MSYLQFSRLIRSVLGHALDGRFTFTSKLFLGSADLFTPSRSIHSSISCRRLESNIISSKRPQELLRGLQWTLEPKPSGRASVVHRVAQWSIASPSWNTSTPCGAALRTSSYLLPTLSLFSAAYPASHPGAHVESPFFSLPSSSEPLPPQKPPHHPSSRYCCCCPPWHLSCCAVSHNTEHVRVLLESFCNKKLGGRNTFYVATACIEQISQ
mmetsp:Transcript_10718/g.22305  ORF Transcript_10718/g.22305 Transcript_10718/m.22305 type:complete len:211 (+) Transcript_10718:1207-1839(+)